MNDHETLLDLEHAAWRALSTAGAAAAFYRDVLADDVLMLLPGGMVIDDRDQVIESMNGAPWASYELADERVLDLSDESAVVAYRGKARRGESTTRRSSTAPTSAMTTGWKLAVHQQTPV